MSSEAPPFLTSLEEGVFTLTFNRPDFGNAMPPSATPSLLDALTQVRDDPSVRCFLLNARGKNFSAGGDVKGFGRSLEMSPSARSQDFLDRLALVRTMVETYLAIPVPVIVACRGGVAGGGLLWPLGADFLYADDTLSIMFAHQRFGLSPDCGVTYLLPRVVGERKARELVLGGAFIGAEEASALGIVSRIVEAEALEDEALKLARRLARGPQQAMRTAKHLLGRSMTTTLGELLEMERKGVADCVADPDFEEGVRAFLDKRKPSYPSAQ
jgi:2-(1,2-epoxy-1,2-dihydrophenyl)acetyl-CoA isomerase